MLLETERLLFRHHLPEDLEPYCEIESDAEYRWPQKVHPREELERSFLQSCLPPKPMGLLATVYKPEARYIGRCGIYPHRTEEGEIVPGEANLAYYLARSHWGRGLATEAGECFLRHGFETLGIRRIHAGVNALNGRSIRVAEKLGFILRASGEGGGSRWHDYEISREDWIRRR
ncbi:MAG TPA: GNAT family N-acetyltransferase [Fimbriimonas sp.]